MRPAIVRTDVIAFATEAYDRFIDRGGVPLGRRGATDDVGKAVATIARGGLSCSTDDAINVGGGFHLHRV